MKHNKFFILAISVFLLRTLSLLAQPTYGLIAHWKLDNDAVDYSGNSNNGTVISALPTTDRFDEDSCALSFNHAFVEIGYKAQLMTSQYSISLWFKTAQTTTMSIYRWSPYGNRIVMINGCVMGIHYDSNENGYSNITTSSYADNEWHNVIVTFDGTTLKLYVDNTLEGETGANPPYYGWAGSGIGINYLYYNQFFIGCIDDVLYYNRALTTSEVNEIFTGNAGFNPWFAYSGNLYHTDGKVSIGIVDTTEALNVGGQVYADELQIKLTGDWPDYVFSNNYHLLALKKLDSFIKTNKHMPGIPPATELYSNGVPLGEMYALQQKKIEELTLYLIELDKKMAFIKSEQQKSIGLLDAIRKE